MMIRQRGIGPSLSNRHVSDLRLQFDAEFFENAALHFGGELKHVTRRGFASIHYDIRMSWKNVRVADGEALATGLIEEEPRGNPSSRFVELIEVLKKTSCGRHVRAGVFGGAFVENLPASPAGFINRRYFIQPDCGREDDLTVLLQPGAAISEGKIFRPGGNDVSCCRQDAGVSQKFTKVRSIGAGVTGKAAAQGSRYAGGEFNST